MAGGLKFHIKEEERLYYLCSENKHADQLLSFCFLRLCFRICIRCVFYDNNEKKKIFSIETYVVCTYSKGVTKALFCDAPLHTNYSEMIDFILQVS